MPVEDRAALSMRASGHPVRAIAQQLGRSRDAVSSRLVYLRSLGVEVPASTAVAGRPRTRPVAPPKAPKPPKAVAAPVPPPVAVVEPQTVALARTKPKLARGGWSSSLITREALTPLWEGGMLIPDIAGKLRCSESWVTRKAREYGLPARGRGWKSPKPEPEAVPVVAREVVLPRDLDAALLVTKGRYALLARLAEREGLTLGRVTQLWHRARAA